MRPIRGKGDGLSLPHLETLSCDLNVRIPVNDNYKSIERRRVLAQTLALIEGKQRDRPAVVLKQYTAHDRVLFLLTCR
jgi:hypothetical protein